MAPSRRARRDRFGDLAVDGQVSSMMARKSNQDDKRMDGAKRQYTAGFGAAGDDL
jgi:hypothetical protein